MDTFLKIAKTCRGEFVVIQEDERVPFVQKILSQLDKIIAKLCNEHVAFSSVSFVHGWTST